MRIPQTATLTQARLKELLHYNPDTGIFTWKERRSGTARKGSVAGSLGGRGYVYIGIDGVSHRAHRLAWLYVNGEVPTEQIDHKNHCRTNNWIENLGLATNTENQKNASRSKANTSGATGVQRITDTRWRATIRINRKSIHLGYFKNKEGAVVAREAANAQYGFHDNHGK